LWFSSDGVEISVRGIEMADHQQWLLRVRRERPTVDAPPRSDMKPRPFMDRQPLWIAPLGSLRIAKDIGLARRRE
jgi:hypothetical protein